MIKVTLKDDYIKEYRAGITVGEIAKSISGRLAKEALAGKLDGRLVDLNTQLTQDGELEIITFDSKEGKDIYRHSASHIMAQAVTELFPTAKLAIGPSIKDGFYYDFMLEKPLSIEDLKRVEKKMQEIIKRNIPFQRHIIGKEQGVELFNDMAQDFKVELIEGLLSHEEISYYKQGDFVDLCSGPHIPSTGKLKAFKLLNVAGAYWRGDEKKTMLQRIYGTAFPKQSLLEQYLHQLEEAKKRDHRKLGKELDLFSFSEEAPGMPFYHPKGMIVRNIILDYWREKHRQYGYEEISTPIMMNQRLWERSGHWENYQENMYFTEVDEENFAIKPMNCPGAILIYKDNHHSYRDLPLRMAELGLVHRRELSGALHGMMRVRSFTQDDAHIFMTPDQIQKEINRIIRMIDEMYKVFGYNYTVELSTKPEKAIGSDEIWIMATDALRKVLENLEIPYTVNEGDGAFYGPKIDFHVETV